DATRCRLPRPLASAREKVTTISGTDDARHRFSVDRKTGVKTEPQRRRRGGYVENSSAVEGDAVRELMDFYGTLTADVLPTEPDRFYKRFRESATALLHACSGNLQEAKAALTQIVDTSIPEK